MSKRKLKGKEYFIAQGRRLHDLGWARTYAVGSRQHLPYWAREAIRWGWNASLPNAGSITFRFTNRRDDIDGSNTFRFHG